MSPLRRLRSLLTVAALGVGLLMCCDDADASFGDARSFAGGAESSISWAVAAANDGYILPDAADTTYPGGSLGGLFNRPGLIGGFAAGFLGAGVVGLLFGHGMITELSGMTSVLGLTFQLALIVMLVRLIWTWWRVDKTTGSADLSPRQLADAYGRSRHEVRPDIDARVHDEPGEVDEDALGHTDKLRP